jgi:hypothetical protein
MFFFIALDSVPMNIHGPVTVRMCAHVFVWVSAMTHFNNLCSGYERVLYELPRWKPG